MLHELREYRFAPDNWARYQQLFLEIAMPVRRHDYGRLLGAWTSALENGQVGFTHLWAYNSLDARAALRSSLAALPPWSRDFIPHAAPLIDAQHLSILHPGARVRREGVPTGPISLERHLARVGSASALASAMDKADSFFWTSEFPDPNEVLVVRLTGARHPSTTSVVSTGIHQQVSRLEPLGLPLI